MLCQIGVNLMKKVSLLLFVVSMFPTVSLAAYNCTPASQWGTGYEYSECDFLQQPKLTDTVKKFWGNPKISSIIGSGSVGVLTKGVHCGKCDNGYATGTNDHFDRHESDSGLYFSCSGDNKFADDDAILMYVATDVSEHGAEFCLTQFTSASWRKVEGGNPATFFVYHQLPRMKDTRNGLKCAWYCESGWGGDRCMTRGIDSVCEDFSYSFNGTPIDTLTKVMNGYANGTFCGNGTGHNYCLATGESTDGVIGRTAVFDFKTLKSSSDVHYQQQIVVGATEFLDYGIKAKPIQLGANGTHTQCPNTSNWTHLYAGSAGGQERTLCLRGYTLQNGNCVKACGGSGSIDYCDGWKAKDAINFNGRGASYYESKPDIYYSMLSGDCKQLRCINGMNFSADDEYACTVCKDTVQQGLCRSTNKCKWCAAGQCFNPDTCKCDACSSVVTKEQMRFGPNKTDECWSVIDADDFRACVTGGISASSEE